MNFAQHQDRAKTRTGLLVVLFFLALLSITVVASLLIVIATSWDNGHTSLNLNEILAFGAISFVCVAAIVGISSAYRLHQLSKHGGQAVAEQLGGKLISTNTSDFKQRRLLNVVEEMALASGMPVPPVYLLAEEHGINAFAAGMSIDDAIIGVTQGALDTFNRDELQGVMAHEFSHILNGDMRLNTRLIGTLFGITCMGLLGQALMRGAMQSQRRASQFRSSNDKDKGSGAGLILVIALVLTVFGWLGTQFGSMIKAAISRQREFLADASAVQFTRNDRGIANALKKIATHSQQSQLQAESTKEVSHMMFGQAQLSGLSAMLYATHPPLHERILRIQPDWDGNFTEHAQVRTTNDEVAGMSGFSAPQSHDAPLTSEQKSQVGQRVMQQLPDALLELAREPYSARFIPLLLIFDGSDEQRELIDRMLPEGSHQEYMPWLDFELKAHLRLPLLELAVPALKSMSPEQVSNFCLGLTEMAKLDNHYALNEWCVINLMEKLVSPPKHPAPQRKTLQTVKESVIWVLRELSWLSQTSAQASATAYQRALQHLTLPMTELDAANPNWSLTRSALEQLVQLRPADKQRFLEACKMVIESDGKVSVSEGELFRVIASFLEVAVPPLTIDAE